jgi:tetratricopeptide (TPR) repeat protein
MNSRACLALSLVIVVSIGAFASAGAATDKTFTDKINANKKVIEESNERLKKDKKDVQALYARGAANFTLGQIYIVMYGPARTEEQNEIVKKQFEDAVADFTEVIKLNPDMMQARIMRGMAYGQMGLSHAAIAEFTHVIDADPKNAFAYYARGREYWQMRDYDKAKEDYGKAVDLDPQWKDYFYQ